MSKKVDSQCRAFQNALDILGRPWNGLILNVLQPGALPFTETRERAQGPGDKILSGRLKALERRGLIDRHVEPGPPVRVSYELTESGRQFGEVARAIERWGQGLSPSPRVPRSAATRPPRRRPPLPRRSRGAS